MGGRADAVSRVINVGREHREIASGRRGRAVAGSNRVEHDLVSVHDDVCMREAGCYQQAARYEREHGYTY